MYEVVLTTADGRETVLHTCEKRETANNVQTHEAYNRFRLDFQVDTFKARCRTTENRTTGEKLTVRRNSNKRTT